MDESNQYAESYNRKMPEFIRDAMENMPPGLDFDEFLGAMEADLGSGLFDIDMKPGQPLIDIADCEESVAGNKTNKTKNKQLNLF